jgi:hypothetical protein
MHGQETRVLGDQAYRGQRVVIREPASGWVATAMASVAHVSSAASALATGRQTAQAVSRQFDTHRLLVTCALANLFMARRHLLRCHGA